MTSGLGVMRGDIFLVDFAPAQADKANFIRPAVVIINDLANIFSLVLVAVLLTSNLERVYLFEVLLTAELTGLDP